MICIKFCRMLVRSKKKSGTKLYHCLSLWYQGHMPKVHKGTIYLDSQLTI